MADKINPKKKLSKKVSKALEKFAEEHLDELWEEAGDFGEWVTEDQLPSLEDYQNGGDPSWFEGLVDANRLDALEKGALPTEAEMKVYQEKWTVAAYSGELDADFLPGYAVCKFQDGDRHEGVALILRTGYSFTRLTTWLEGVFATVEDAIRYIEENVIH